MSKSKELICDLVNFCRKQAYFLVFAMITLILLLSLASETVRNFWVYHHTPDGNPVWTGEATRLIFIAIGGIWSVWGLIHAQHRHAQHRLEISRRAQVPGTLQRGLELIAKDDLVMRTAGVRLLGKLHEEDEDVQQLITGVLGDFVREKAGSSDDDQRPEDLNEDGRQDIATAISTLGRLLPEDDRKRETIMSFVGLDLRNLDLSSANLSSANFARADLSGTRLIETNLEKANLNLANLRKANLAKAIIFLTETWCIDLTDAYLGFARLEEIDLSEADLSRTDFTGATLAGVSPNCLPQAVLDGIIYETHEEYDLKVGGPPKIPNGLILPRDGAYKWDFDEDGVETKFHSCGPLKGQPLTDTLFNKDGHT